MGQRLSRGYALHSEGSEALANVSISIIIIEVHVCGILDISGCGAKLEVEEDAALLVRAARDTSLHETGGAEGAGECVAKLSFGGHEQFGPAL